MNNYEDEFNQEMSIVEFDAWVGRNIVIYVQNMSKGTFQKRSLHTWIKWFLDWCEYTDYMDNKYNA